jgi:eukaryotic-like serine/threonine-protein kinase
MNRQPTAPPQLTNRPPADLDAILEAFEDQRALGGSADFESFLPDRADSHFRAIAVELIRVDLEYAWSRGQRKRLSDYRESVPEVFGEPLLLSGAAFEEYRLRRLAGESVSAAEYAKQFGVAVDAWPEISPSVGDASGQNGRVTGEDFPKVGDRFADFKLRSEIGRGAFARVYLAEQSDLARRPVVLKISTTHSLEPQHLARLQHTNIVPIYSVHEWHNWLAVCMPFFGSRTLADLTGAVAATDKFPRSGAALLSTVAGFRDETTVRTPDRPGAMLPQSDPIFPDLVSEERDRFSRLGYVEFVLALVAEIASGLDHAHRRGIVHRDVKPANILVTDEGRPMLLDFNLSDELVVNGRQSLAVGGTLPYMAPEHLQAVLRGGNVDARSDLYSLGVITYQLLTRILPYPVRGGLLDESLDAMIRDRSGSPPSVRKFNRLVSPAVEAIVQKCLEPSLERRYKSVGEVIEDIERQLDHQPLKHASNPSIVERTAKWRVRHPRVTSIGSLAAAVLVMSLVFAGLWVARDTYVARLEAEQQYAQFVDRLPAARMAASVPNSEGPLVAIGVDAVAELLQLYGTPNDEFEQNQPEYANLPPTQRRELDARFLELGYLAARGEAIQSKLAKDEAVEKQHLARALQFNDVAWNRCQAVGSQQAVLKQRNGLLSKLGRPQEPNRIAADTASGPLDELLQSQDLLQNRDYSESLHLLETLRTEQPTDPVIWLLAGNANAGLGRFYDAEGCYTTAIALQPDSYVAYYNRALCRTQLKEYTNALDDFERVLALRPDEKCVLLNRALTYEAAGDLSAALADLDAAIAGGQVPPRAYLLRSRIRARLGDVQGAKRDRLRGLAEEPTDEVGWVALGFAQMKEDPSSALDDFRRALALNPHSQLALKNIVYVTADRLSLADEAMKSLNALIALDESNASALVGRAVLFARLKQRDNALADLKHALRASQEPIILFQGACCLSLTAGPNNGDAARGLLLLSRALELQPQLLARATSDPDLEKLRSQPGFDALLEKIGDLNQLKRDLAIGASRSDQ